MVRALPLALLAALIAGPAWADGVMLDLSPSAAHELVGQKAQRAWLEWQGGREKLTIAVQKSSATPRLAWLIPLPAPAKDVKLALVNELPGWAGEEIRAAARYSLWKYVIVLYFFGAFLLFGGSGEWLGLLLVMAFLASIAIPSFGPSPGSSAPVEARTFARAELGGLVSELVEAPSAGALRDYMKAKSLLLPKSVAKTLEGRLGPETSLIVSWAEGSRIQDSLAVEASFPAAKPFYPMRLTSAYGSRNLTVELKLKGWHSPDPEPAVQGTYRLGYYHDPAAGIRYTRVLFHGKAGSASEDWTFSPKRPAAGLWLALGAAASPWLATLALLLVSGIAASIVVGACAYPDWRSRSGLGRLCLLGLSTALPYFGPAALLKRWRGEESPSAAFWTLHLASLIFVLLFSYGLFRLWPIDRAPVAVAIGGDHGLIRKSEEGATRGNLGAIRSALSIYYGDTGGRYPPDMAALAVGGKYMKSIPLTRLPPYHSRSDEVSTLGTEEYSAGLFGDTGGWAYVTSGAKAGTLVVDCLHTDSRGKLWTEY